MALDWKRDGADWPNRELSRFVSTRGARFHVQRGGSGRRVLLLHGAGASTHSWRDIVPRLTPEYDVMALDLPGQGFSTGRADRFTLPLMAQDIGALLETEGFEPDLVVGHSAGAAIGLRMALDGHAVPGPVLSLNGALAPFRGPAGVLFPPLAKLLSLNPLTGAFFARTASSGNSVRNLIEGTGSRIDAEGLALYRRLIADPGHVSATLAMMARWDLKPLMADVGRLRVPVILALGQNDRAVPPETTRALAGAFRDARVLDFTGLGHLMHEEDPASFAGLIARTVPGG